MPFLKELYNGVNTFPYYYGGQGNFSQTSLPYSDDIRENGYSEQPYVQVGIDPDTQYTLFDDGFIRGGIINTGLSVFRDEIRLGKFLTDVKSGVKGPLFLTKQIGLNRSNPQFENEAGVDGESNNRQNGFRNRSYNREYNLLDVSINAASSPFGLHYDQNGLITGQRSYAGNYQNGEEGIAAANMTSFDEGNFRANRLVSYFEDMSIYPDDYVLKVQDGGSDSVYGLGDTIIRRVRDTGPLNDATTDKPLSSWDYYTINNFDTEWDKLFTQKQPTIPSTSEGNYNKDFKDFRSISDNNINSTDYPVYNIENRLGTATNLNPSYKNIEGTDKYAFQSNTLKVDSINTININTAAEFYGASNGATNLASQNTNLFTSNQYSINEDNLSGYFGRDIIKFRIEVNNNDAPGSNNNEVLAFRAYINSMDDDFEAKWNEYRYMGRGEPFFVYEGFSRDISLSFTIFSHTAQEMAPLYSKLNYLMSSLTPDYSSQLLMRGNYHYLTIGDYIYRQPGIITSLRLSNFFDHNWEIALKQPEQALAGTGEDLDQYELPKSLVVGLTFKPIHTFVPRRNTKDNYTAPFVTPDIKAYNYGYKVITQDGRQVNSNKYLPITKRITKVDTSL